METQNTTPQPEVPQENALSAEAYLADKERRQKLERDLVTMGLNAEEIRRLLSADSHTTKPPKASSTPAKASLPALPVTPPKEPAPSLLGRRNKQNPNRVTAEHLQSFAAELISKKAEAQVKVIEEATKELPAFRESSMQEKREAETLLREANNLRRREKFADAERKCREALEMIPKDAPALELLGDILVGVAKIDPALAAYRRAMEADPRRTTAEKKYGDLLVMQQQWSGVDPEAVQGNPWVPTLLSTLLPGAGQIANGEWFKGILVMLSLVGIYYYRSFAHITLLRKSVDWNSLMLLSLAGVIYVWGISDALRVSRQKAR